MKTVLIIEDNLKNMKLTSDLLEVKGYAVLTADNAEAGLTLAAEHLPDLILMDIQMPGVDGFTALTRLREAPDTAAIPVAAFTASVMTTDRARISEAGFDAFIGKPIRMKEFLATVAELCQE